MKTIIAILVAVASLLLADEPNRTKTEQVYYLAEPDFFSKADNSAEVCQAYVDALNEHPPVRDVFDAPFHPNSEEFQVPDWKRMDIYKQTTRDVYVRIYNYQFNRNVKKGRYFYIEPYQEKDTGLYHKEGKARFDGFDRNIQLYNVLIDIDNNGTKESVIKVAQNRYVPYFNRYSTELIVFKYDTREYLEKNRDIDAVLTENLKDRVGTVLDMFIYKNMTYIKRSSSDENLLYELYINRLDENGTLIDLCHIRRTYEN